MQAVLKNVSDERLRAYVIWEPMLTSDDRAAAVERSGEFTDPRVTYFWDGDQLTGKAWQRVLGTSRLAWDVYFLYGAQTRWDAEPTVPEFWMHQLGGAEDKAPFLDASRFEAKVKELVGTIKASDSPKKAPLGIDSPSADAKPTSAGTIGQDQAIASNSNLATTTIRIEGMTCGGCAVSVHQALVKRDGVKSVKVSFEKQQAIVTYDPAKVSLEQLTEAIDQTGFKAKL
jgi:copper chaperone CopZ